jgi:hypothetical protein
LYLHIHSGGTGRVSGKTTQNYVDGKGRFNPVDITITNLIATSWKKEISLSMAAIPFFKDTVRRTTELEGEGIHLFRSRGFRGRRRALWKVRA